LIPDVVVLNINKIHSREYPVCLGGRAAINSASTLEFSYSGFFYVLTVGVKGYCCIWSHSITHTHTRIHIVDRTRLGERSARRRGLYPHNTQHSQETNIHARRRDSKPQFQPSSACRTTA